jgi:hypothetical protein
MKSGGAIRTGAKLALLILVGGCGGDRALPGARILDAFDEGARRADVLDALPAGPADAGAGGAEVHGYAVDRYFVGGNAVEVLWVTDPGGVPPGVDPRRAWNPVIFVNDALDGWGWDHFDRRAESWGIREPVEAEEPQPGPGPDGGPDPDAGAPEETPPDGDRREGRGSRGTRV